MDEEIYANWWGRLPGESRARIIALLRDGTIDEPIRAQEVTMRFGAPSTFAMWVEGTWGSSPTVAPSLKDFLRTTPEYATP